MTDPVILADAHQLHGADGRVQLFQVALAEGGTLYMKPDNTVNYQGQTYEGWAIQITGTGQSATEEVSRPTLSFQNFNGTFSASVGRGELDQAVVTLWTVLKADLDSNTARYTEQMWYISQVMALNRNVIVFQLRGLSDSAVWMVPPRMFAPPDFPTVSLT